MSGFRFPDGVEFDGEDSEGNISFRVSIPLDDHGYFGRQCPHCNQIFRVQHDDYERLPDDLTLWCIYCGHTDDHSEFITEQQLERVLRAAGDYGEQLIGQTLDKTFSNLSRRSRGSSVSISYRSRPFYPTPLPGIDEEGLIRERSCGSCGVRYAVFGEHRFCPVCGPLTPVAVAEDALAAEEARLGLLGELPLEAAAKLREQGVFDRIYADTIENLVGIVESLADAVFRADVSSVDQILKGRGNVFQRLDETADLFLAHLDVDLRRAMANDWSALQDLWAARHVMTQNDGMVDATYLRKVHATTLKVGHRLQIAEGQARTGIAMVQVLALALAGGEPDS